MPQRDNEYPPSLRRLLKEIEENGDREPRVFDYKTYLRVHGATLPDGRIDGLEDAIEIIGGYYINRDLPSQRSALRTIDSREFEVLVANLYKEMGYAVTLTSARRDEGRDVIAEKSSLEGKQRVLIECKLYVRSVVDVQIARALLGVVALERATGGVIVTTGHCEKGVYDLANKDSQFL